MKLSAIGQDYKNRRIPTDAEVIEAGLLKQSVLITIDLQSIFI